MKITWLGHASFRIETAEAVILLDPWLEGNPAFPETRRDEALARATHVLITHGHFDHAAEAQAIGNALGIPLVGIFDWIPSTSVAVFIQAIQSKMPTSG
ncbi:MAG: MBL fold metallo-hydrolase, partial [Myxococcota bacterium]